MGLFHPVSKKQRFFPPSFRTVSSGLFFLHVFRGNPFSPFLPMGLTAHTRQFSIWVLAPESCPRAKEGLLKYDYLHTILSHSINHKKLIPDPKCLVCMFRSKGTMVDHKNPSCRAESVGSFVKWFKRKETEPSGLLRRPR